MEVQPELTTNSLISVTLDGVYSTAYLSRAPRLLFPFSFFLFLFFLTLAQSRRVKQPREPSWEQIRSRSSAFGDRCDRRMHHANITRIA